MKITDVKCTIRSRDGAEETLCLKKNEGSVCFEEQACGEGAVFCLSAEGIGGKIDLEQPFTLLAETNIRPLQMTAMYMLND